jgi:hypothetical protein
MRGWFQLILDSPVEADRPTCRGFAAKRLMGFEPTTFCMAIREVIGEPSPSIQSIGRAFMIEPLTRFRREYAWIGIDMPRVGHFRPEVPEIKEAGLIGLACFAQRNPRRVSEQSQDSGWGEPDTLEAEARVLGDQVVVAVVMQNTRTSLVRAGSD